MGLTTFAGSQPTLKEAVVAKKYLISEVELFPREEQKTQKRFVKAIAYKFPIEQKVLTQFDECGASVETVVLLSKDML
jgi:site-specific DNA recombinase